MRPEVRETPPLVETLAARTLVGMHRAMCLVDDETSLLWRSFMPRRGEVEHRLGTDLYSVRVHDAAGALFAPHTRCVKWAAVAVSATGARVDGMDAEAMASGGMVPEGMVPEGMVPEGMARLVVPAGAYALYPWQGRPSDFEPTARWLFGDWLPASGFELDDRPHFEVLDEGWRPDDPEARETICIPVRKAVGKGAGGSAGKSAWKPAR